MLAAALTSRVDEHAGELVRIILSLLEEHNAKVVQIHEVRAKVRKACPGSHLENFLEDYLQILGNYVCLVLHTVHIFLFFFYQ